MFQVAVRINILYMQYIKLVVLKTWDYRHPMIHLGSILSLTVLIACHQMLIPKGQGGFFFPFNYNTWYLICEMFRNLDVSSAVSAWSLPGHETGGVHPTQLKQPILLMAHSCLAHTSH